ncbi:helix-turn-helix transcriptional regulator [Gluconobacter sp. OJB]|uniref:AraC family transcriptional regulator n=1 Tax=Gluconobacter sp. OJB TaxID=3145196 RepID=UPI0031F86448
MPFLRDWADLADVMTGVNSTSQDIATVGVKMVALELELDHHSHLKAELLLCLSGTFRCEVDGGIWIVPPQSALWVPAGVTHRVRASGNIESYTTFIPPHAAAKLPILSCTIDVTSLLRELIIRSAYFSLENHEQELESNIASLLLHEISNAPVGNLHLPMPIDPKLRSIFHDLVANPSHRGTLEFWAKRVGLSVRSLERLIATETGMSFGKWRQRLSILLSVQWLANGVSVKQIACDLGYENVGNFTTMFRKALGVSPTKYIAGRIKN